MLLCHNTNYSQQCEANYNVKLESLQDLSMVLVSYFTFFVNRNLNANADDNHKLNIFLLDPII